MSIFKAQRILNAAENGTLSGSQLETLVTTEPARLGSIGALLSMEGQVRRLCTSNALTVFCDSPTVAEHMVARSRILATVVDEPGGKDLFSNSAVARAALIGKAESASLRPYVLSLVGGRAAKYVPEMPFTAKLPFNSSYMAQDGSKIISVYSTTSQVSEDGGVTWGSPVAVGSAGASMGLAAGNGLVLALYSDGVYSLQQNGTWVRISTSATLRNIFYANGYFFGANTGSVRSESRSLDGITWVAASVSGMSTSNYLKIIAYSNNVFGLADGGNANTSVFYSPNSGLSWAGATVTGLMGNLMGLAAGNGKALVVTSTGVAVCENTGSPTVWTFDTTNPAKAASSVLFVDGAFVAFFPSKILTSVDCVTWVERSAAISSPYLSYSLGGNIFAGSWNMITRAY